MSGTHIVEKAVDALLEAAGDASDDVRDTVLHALRTHGEKEKCGKLVLLRCKNFLAARKPNTTTNPQRSLILIAMTHIVRVASVLDDLTLSDVVQCGASEMADFTSECSKNASALCVELCERSPRLCCLFLVDSIQLNMIPNWWTVQTLADFAVASPLRFLPYLKETHSKLVPLLGMIKQDNHRQVFASAFGNFCHAVMELANRNDELTPRSADAASLNKSHFTDGHFTIFNLLLNDWSNKTSDLKIRVNVFSALGYLGATVSDDNIIIIIPKLIPVLLGKIKSEKPRDMTPMVNGLAAFLSVCNDAQAVIAPQLEPLFNAILAAMAATVSDKDKDPAVQQTLTKNLHALSRCAEHLTLINPDTFLTHVGRTLNAKTGSKDATVRASVLALLKHIISRKNLEGRLDAYKDTIIATVKLAITDLDWQIRRACVQVIMTMGACAEVAYFNCAGSSDLLMFIIQSASIPPSVIAEWNAKAAKGNAGGTVSPAEVAEMSSSTLTLLTSAASQKHLDFIMWPYLFEHLCQHPTKPELINCFPTICRCITKLAPRLAKTDRYYVDFGVQVNVPRPPVIAIKFLVLATRLGKQSDTQVCLAAMECLAPLLDEPFVFADPEGNCPTPIATLWLATIPELQKYLASGDATPQEWEDTICKLLSKTCGCRQEEDWVASIASALVAQFPSYASEPALSRVSLTMLGLAVSKCARKDFVASHTDMILDLAKHNDAEHRLGAARAFGYVAAQHTDLALDRLGMLTKSGEKKGMFAKKEEGVKVYEEISKSIAAYGLCYAARRMSSGLLTSRLEATMLPSLSVILSDSKVPEVREAVLGALPLLQQPIMKIDGFALRGRDAMFELILTSISFDNPKANTKPVMAYASLGIQAITALTDSSPTPTVAPAIVEKLIKLCVSLITKVWVGVEEASTEHVEIIQRAGTLLCSLLSHVNAKDVLPFLTPLEPLLRSASVTERQRSLSMYISVLKYYQKRIEDVLKDGDGDLTGYKMTAGIVVAYLLPRLSDVDNGVKKNASEAIVATFRIHLMINSSCVDAAMADAAIKEVRQMRKRADSMMGDTDKEKVDKEMATVVKTLCVQIVNVLPQPVHFMPLLTQLLKTGLRDSNDEGAHACCVVLHGAVRGLGSALSETEQKQFLELMVATVGEISGSCKEVTMNGLLLSIRNLCKHNPANAFAALMQFPMPHSESVIKAFQAVAGDTGLVTLLLNQCMDVILNSQLFHEKTDPKDRKKVTTELAPIPLAAAAAMGWICDVVKGADVARPMRGGVLCTLFLYLGAAHHVGNSVAYVAQACKLAICALATNEVTRKRIAPRWAALSAPSEFLYTIADVIQFCVREELFPDGEEDKNPQFTSTGQLVLEPTEATKLTSEVLSFILAYSSKPFVYHRKVSTCILAQLMRQCVDDKKMLHSIINALLGRCGPDEQSDIKVFAVAGVKEISCHSLALVEHYVSPIIGTLLNGCNDPSIDVILGSMSSLLHIMDHIPCKGALSAVAVNITSRVKSMFEHTNPAVRTLCFDIFATMLRLANGDGLDPIAMEQFVGISLAAVLIHVEDEEVVVRHASKKALGEIVRFIAANFPSSLPTGKDQLLDVLKHVVPITTRTKWEEFSNDFSRVWVSAYTAHVNDLMVNVTTFFGSEWASLRAAAAVLVGYLVHHIPPEESARINVEQACFGLAQIINPGKEKSPAVRAKAGRALGLL